MPASSPCAAASFLLSAYRSPDAFPKETKVMTLLTRFLVASGLIVVALSIGWWWITYREVIGYNYLSLTSAGLCLVSNTDICQLARSLCRSTHPLAIIDYWSASIWIGTAALCASMVTATARKV
jgi:hypothetical protein